MKIYTNISSLMAKNQLDLHSRDLNSSIEKLSSGKRINSASDDAAGLSISEGLTSDIRGTSQAKRNVIDAVSFIQTAEGALSEITNLLHRSRKLLIQSANGTYSDQNRVVINQELEQITNEVERLSKGTEFNGQKVFGDETALTGKDAIEYALEAYWIPESEHLIEEFFGINGRGNSIELKYENGGVGGTAAYVTSSNFSASEGGFTTFSLTIDLDDYNTVFLPDGSTGVTGSLEADRLIAHEMVHAVMGANMNFGTMPGWFTEGTAELIHGADDRVAVDLALAGSSTTLMNSIPTAVGSPSSSAGYSQAYVAARMLHEAAGGQNGGGIKAIMEDLADGQSLDTAIQGNTSFTLATFQTHVTTNGASYVDGMNLQDADTGSVHGSEYGFKSKSRQDVLANFALEDNEDRFKLTGATDIPEKFALDIQSGSNRGDQTSLDRIFIDSGAIGIRGIDFSDTAFAIEQVDFAIKTVSQKQGLLGAVHSRLEFTSRNLSTMNELASTARSQILDVDYASESAKISRVQVLMQAGQAMLAQANSQPQQVLQLLL